MTVKQFSSKSEELPKEYGFLNEVGSHSSRTIMFKELGLLLDSTSLNATFNDLKKRVIEDNILRKKSISGRKKTFGFLKQLYSIDPAIPIFRLLRWGLSQNIDEKPKRFHKKNSQNSPASTGPLSVSSRTGNEAPPFLQF